MKLLLDENLSPALVKHLDHLFPGSAHVHDAGLGQTDDLTVWEHAKRFGFTMVSKNSDHYEFSLLKGHPPKLIWIRLGNCSTARVAQVLTGCHAALLAFDGDDEESIFVIQ